MMSRLPVSCTLAAALVALLFALGPQSLHATPLCPFGNATLHVTYSVSGGGTVVGLGPVASVGEVTYDGKGNSNAVYTASLNGKIVPVIVAGTYTVNPDCTATAVEASSHFQNGNMRYSTFSEGVNSMKPYYGGVTYRSTELNISVKNQTFLKRSRPVRFAIRTAYTLAIPIFAGMNG